MTRPPTDPATPAKRSTRVRSAVSNGKVMLPGVSRCSASGRRFRDLIDDLTAELGGSLSIAEQLQVRNAAGLVVHVEQLQAAMLKGEPVDSEELTRASNSAQRVLDALKRARPTPRRRRSNPLPHGAPHPLAASVAAE